MRHCARRRTLATLGAISASLLLPRAGRAHWHVVDAPRMLSFHHLHTRERLEVTYFADGEYVAASLRRIDWLLRDFRTGESIRIDPALLDLLHRLALGCGGGTFEIISAYRSPATNAALADSSAGVARASLHVQGRAIDVRLGGYATGRLHDAAVLLALGGVGYYPKSDFVHLDTGRVRIWGPENGQ
jgi:uncharacterized protein YcbK (DUF882 family)